MDLCCTITSLWMRGLKHREVPSLAQGQSKDIRAGLWVQWASRLLALMWYMIRTIWEDFGDMGLTWSLCLFYCFLCTEDTFDNIEVVYRVAECAEEEHPLGTLGPGPLIWDRGSPCNAFPCVSSFLSLPCGHTLGATQNRCCWSPSHILCPMLEAWGGSLCPCFHLQMSRTGWECGSVHALGTTVDHPGVGARLPHLSIGQFWGMSGPSLAATIHTLVHPSLPFLPSSSHLPSLPGWHCVSVTRDCQTLCGWSRPSGTGSHQIHRVMGFHGPYCNRTSFFLPSNGGRTFSSLPHRGKTILMPDDG